MKLKSVVASMLALGVASGVALAASSDTVSRAEFDAMKDQVTKMESALNQNQGGIALNTSTTRDWFNRVTVSGQVAIDAFASSENSYRFQENSSTNSAIDLPMANLFVDAQVNDWVKAHAGIHFHSVSRDGLANVYKATYKDSDTRVDEAYVTLGNFAQSPFYVRAGREFVPFGSYKRFDITPSLTQMLTETRATALQAGFVMANGVNGAVYTFNGTDTDKNAHKHRINNFGANLGVANSYDNINYQASVGYLYNMADVNYINSGMISENVDHTVDGVSVDASVQSGPFDASAHYVTALRSFSGQDVNTHGVFTKLAPGAKPSAWAVDAGYSFNTAGYASRLGLGYQHSSQANNVGPTVNGVITPSGIPLGLNYGLPKERYLAQYSVNVWKNTDLGFQVYHDRDYAKPAGSDNKATTGVVRLTVNFA